MTKQLVHPTILTCLSHAILSHWFQPFLARNFFNSVLFTCVLKSILKTHITWNLKGLGKKINDSICVKHEAGTLLNDANSGHTRVAIDGCQCKIVQFIFGDSLSDVGNNKYLSRSLAQASLPWYGIDFGNGLPNGRFTNGRTVADIIGDNTGLPRPPAFLDPSLTEDVMLENGVNYASGGGGILNETGGYFALHSLGARQLMVFGLGPMGCIPLQRVLSTSGSCQDRTNKLAISFNQATSKLIDSLTTKLANASYKFGDAYDVVSDVITNPTKYGFNNSDSPCCSFGRIRPALTCVPASTLCKDRSKYVFWDEYHPSDSANELIANELIKKFGFLRVNDTNAPSPAPAVAPSHRDSVLISPSLSLFLY
ncbi:hypothetical protein GH714_041353 [Hevea brasiliensis]|uniref:GDSL esterase/lipase n=1 Tax=Hevea brasiliensis TaxID=3981 RepID=A0A6A6N0E3_HEVBR|nr:hypothetical protein GH714_041353 [Hevea brasiliensis]